jgi:hypothetical protein
MDNADLGVDLFCLNRKQNGPWIIRNIDDKNNNDAQAKIL